MGKFNRRFRLPIAFLFPGPLAPLDFLGAMKEEILQFAWESSSYDSQNLQSLQGQALRVIRPGRKNHNQGPDFLDATLEIDGVQHTGHIEIHVDGRAWYHHGHHLDPLYNPVILHVSLNPASKPILRQDGTPIPDLSLENRLSPVFVSRGQQLLTQHAELPCTSFIRGVPEDIGQRMLDRLGRHRLRNRMQILRKKLKDPGLDWGQLLWEELAAGFGGKVNGESFREMARRLPLRIVRRYASSVPTREALLYGMSGLLAGPAQDDYQDQLQEEWRFLESMHRLPGNHFPLRYHRMRPGGMPHRRLSQLGHFLSQFHNFSDLLTTTGINRFLHGDLQVSSYWERHDGFGRPGQARTGSMGKDTRRTIALNSLLPIAILYAEAHGNQQTANLLEIMPRDWPAEKNKVTQRFLSLGLPIGNAREGQGVLDLEKRYCEPKRCLECAIGRWILGK